MIAGTFSPGWEPLLMLSLTLGEISSVWEPLLMGVLSPGCEPLSVSLTVVKGWEPLVIVSTTVDKFSSVWETLVSPRIGQVFFCFEMLTFVFLTF